jgi:histidine ammonia-lyase
MHDALLVEFVPVIEDRALEADLRHCLLRIGQRHWRLHA